MKRILAVVLAWLLLAGCGEAPDRETVPPETVFPSSSPTGETVPDPETNPKGYILDRLEQCLDDGVWSVRFWIMPGTGPALVKMPEREYGDALRQLFSGLDWELTQQPRYWEDPETAPSSLRPAPYSIQITAGYIPGYGDAAQPIMCSTDDPVLQLGIRTGEGYGSLYFRADGAEGLCDAISDLWPGPEVDLGRARVLPRESEEATARAYLEEVCARLEADGHITGHELRFLEVEPPYEAEGEEVPEERNLIFQTLLALRPARPELECWQEGREESGWVTWGKVRVYLYQASDGFYTLGAYDWIPDPEPSAAGEKPPLP